MPSSISSSDVDAVIAVRHEQGGAARAEGAWRRIVIIATALLLSLVAIELGTRFAFSHISRIERRIESEHHEVMGIRHEPNERSILLVGNSLPLMAVDMELLKRLMPAGIRPHRFVVESTSLLDWEFGLRRLFADGARPDIVVVSVGATNVLPTAIRGDYSAYYLFRTVDIPEIADTLRYDNTRKSSLYFARYSRFFAGRAALRNFVLNRVDAPYGRILQAMPGPPARPVRRGMVQAAARDRLSRMRAVAASNGSTVILLTPPGFSPEEEAEILAGAAQAGVKVLAPVPQKAWGAEMFSDGFHLNVAGEAAFTRLLAPQLAAAVADSSSGPRR